MPPQGLFQAQEGVGKWAPEAMASTVELSTLYFVQHLALTPTICIITLTTNNAKGI